MNEVLATKRPDDGRVEEEPFYGWRFVRVTLPDGTETTETIPLTQEDLLYPEEDDFVVQEPWHTQDFTYCYDALTTYFAGRPGVVVLGDCRVDFGVQGIRPLGPDIDVWFDVRQWLREATFHPAEEGGRPMVVLEIASPSTRHNDVGIKLDLYWRVGVERYVVVDRGPNGEDAPRLVGYQRGAADWVPLPFDARGQLNLGVGLLLGIEEGRPWLYEASTGERLVDHAGAVKAQMLAETRARQEAEARMQTETHAQQETQGRILAETRARQEAEAEQAETHAQQETQGRILAETRARQEAEARKQAETHAQRETQARVNLEARLRELEEQLRRQQDERRSDE